MGLQTEYVMTSGGVLVPKVRGNLYNGINLTSATPSTFITGAPGYAITGYRISYNGATIATPQNVIVTLTDSSAGQFAVALINITSAVQAANNTTCFTNPPGFYFNNKVANSTCRGSLSATLASGFIFVELYYAQIPWVG